MSTLNRKLNRSQSISLRNQKIKNIRQSLQGNPVFSTNHTLVSEKLGSASLLTTTRVLDARGSLTSLEEEIIPECGSACPNHFEEKFELKEKIG